MPSRPLSVRFALRIVAWVARLVPYRERRSWLLEWRAEIINWWDRVENGEVPGSQLRLLSRAACSSLDAWTVRQLTQGIASTRPKENWMNSLLEDLRFAARSYRRRASQTALLLATLALGIGGATAIFSLLYAVVLDPLPYEEPDKIVQIWPARSRSMSKELLVELQKETTSYEVLAAISEDSFSLVDDGRSQLIYGPTVTADFLRVLRAPMILGRAFETGDDRDGSRHVVLSWSFWQQRYGGDEGIVGERLELNGIDHVIAGVTERGFSPPTGDWDVMATHLVDPAEPDWDGRYLDIIGRLAPDVTIGQADGELRALALRWAEESGVSSDWAADASVTSLQEAVVGDARPSLLLLAGATGFLLLIVVANVTNLLLARALARERELSVRQALGASRWRLTRQLLTETTLLSLAGGALGVLAAAAALPGLVSILPADLPRLEHAAIVPEVIAVALGLALLTGVIVGIAPATLAARRDPQLGLGGAGRQSSASPSRRRLRSALVVIEVALAVVLLAGAGVLVRSFWNTLNVDPGFDSQGLVSLNILPGPDRWESPEELDSYYVRLRERLAEIPGVRAASVVHAVPVAETGWRMGTYPADDPPAEGELTPIAHWRPVDPYYFQAAGIQVLAGRPFAPTETAVSESVAIVNESLARAYLAPNESLDQIIGRDLVITFEGRTPHRVVGVIEDVKILGLRQAAPHTAYRPYSQVTPRLLEIGVDQRSMVVRSNAAALSLRAALRSAVGEFDPLANIQNLEPMERVIAESLARSRAITILLFVFSLTALALGAIGIYGVMGYTVRERTLEMGIRIALGAPKLTVLRTLMASGLRLVAIGLAIGGLSAVMLNRLLTSELFEVGPTDPISLSIAASTLIAAASLSIWLPARRAGRIDPIEVLRAE